MMELIEDRKRFAQMWASDTTAGADQPRYKAPGGELFQVANILSDGTVIADSGRKFTCSEFNACRKVEG